MLFLKYMIYVYMYDNSDYVWWPKQSWPQMSMATATTARSFSHSWRKPNDVEMKVVGSKAAQSIKNSNKKPI